MAIAAIRDDIIRRVIKIEGGYVNDSRDSGGETRWGITIAVARRHGLDVRQLTQDQAIAIYERDYWHPLNLDGIASLSPKIAEEIFDAGVNVGPNRAAEWLQSALNLLNQNANKWPDLRVDGDIGAGTLAAIDAYFRQRGARGEPVLLNMLNTMQGNYYLSLATRRPKDEAFVFGWQQNRVSKVTAESPEQMLGLDLAAPLPAAAAPVGKVPLLDWLPGIKTHLIAVAGVALSAAELMGVNIPAPVYGILASLGVSTAYRGFQRSRV